MLKKTVKRILHTFGVDIIRQKSSQNFNFILEQTLKYYDINLVVDIGANIGQFGEEVISAGYSDRLISFEPQEKAFSILKSKVQKYPFWEAHCCAIGSNNSTSEINISANSVSSSILDSSPKLSEFDKQTTYIKKEKIHIKTLDHFLNQNEIKNKNLYFKMDVQGYEKEILKGNESLIRNCKVIQVELSFVALYNGALIADQMIQLMKSWGFEIHFIYPEFFDKQSGKLLEASAIFVHNQSN